MSHANEGPVRKKKKLILESKQQSVNIDKLEKQYHETLCAVRLQRLHERDTALTEFLEREGKVWKNKVSLGATFPPFWKRVVEQIEKEEKGQDWSSLLLGTGKEAEQIDLLKWDTCERLTNEEVKEIERQRNG